MTNYKPFVKAWVESFNTDKGIQGVATAVNLDKDAVSRKANYLRRRGVNLPAMPRGTQVFSVDGLNDYINQNVTVRK